jgi:Family of unknown function (DUF6129)
MIDEEVEQVVQELERGGLSVEVMSLVRARFPTLRFTVCAADDLEGRQPHLTRPGFEVHLLASDGHCLSLTSRLENAVGLVLATTDD